MENIFCLESHIHLCSRHTSAIPAYVIKTCVTWHEISGTRYWGFVSPKLHVSRHIGTNNIVGGSIKRGSVWMKSCFFTYFSLTSVRHWPVIIRPFLTVLQHGTTVHLRGQWTACPTSWPGVCIRHNLRPECFCTFRLISGLSLGTADVRSGGPDGTRHLSTGPAVSGFLACPGREQGPCWGASCAPQPATAVPLQDLVTLPTALSQPFLTFEGPVLIPRAPSSTPRTCMPLPGHCYVPPPQPFSCRSRPQHAPVPASSSSSRPWSYCGHLPQLCWQTPYSSASADDDGFDSPDTHTPIPPPTPNTPPPHPTTTPHPRTPHPHTPHPTPTPPHTPTPVPHVTHRLQDQRDLPLSSPSQAWLLDFPFLFLLLLLLQHLLLGLHHPSLPSRPLRPPQLQWLLLKTCRQWCKTGKTPSSRWCRPDGRRWWVMLHPSWPLVPLFRRGIWTPNELWKLSPSGDWEAPQAQHKSGSKRADGGSRSRSPAGDVSEVSRDGLSHFRQLHDSSTSPSSSCRPSPPSKRLRADSHSPVHCYCSQD